MRLILIRDVHTLKETLGVLTVTESPLMIVQTIERPWLPDPDVGDDGGEPLVSCVPVGIYALVPHDTAAHPRTFELVNDALDVSRSAAPGKRSEILIHPANWASQLEGCIAPGRERARDEIGWMVTHSREAFADIMRAVPWMPGHTIEIRNHYT